MRGNIILIEDNDDEAALIQRYIERTAFVGSIIRFSTGEDALKYLGNWLENGKENTVSIKPSLIILDLRLPGADGLEILQKLRSYEKMLLIPIVILSSSASAKDVMKSFREGANSFVRKSGNGREFTRKVQRIVEYWLEVNEPLLAGGVQ